MKTAIVSGAHGNLGKAVVSKFLQEGFRVVGTIVPGHVKHETKNDHYLEMEVDLSDEKAAADFVENVIAQFGSVEAGILTVGGYAPGNLQQTSSGDIRSQVALNFETAFHVAKPLFAHLLKQGSGRIFLVGSKPGLDVSSGGNMLAYSLSKSLIFRLSELLNASAKGTDVVTSVVVPSTIDTEENREAMPGAHFENWVQPSAIADAIHFYCTPAADAIREPVIKVYNKA